MKKLLPLIVLCTVFYSSMAQITYFKAEWTSKDKQDLFSGICKIETDDQHLIKGEIVWTYWAIDSADQAMMDMYKGKRGKSGIEFIEGNYFADTHDMIFTGQSKTDPYEIIGLDKYSLKLSANKQVLYGSTATEGTNKGLFYATKLSVVEGEKEFLLASSKLKKSMNRK